MTDSLFHRSYYCMFRGSLRTVPLLVAVAMSAAGAQDRGRREFDRDYRSNIDTTFAFDRTGTVTLRLGGGDIVVTGWSRDQIRIHASSEDRNVRLDASAARVTLELTGSYRSNGDTRFEVSIPTGVRVIAGAQSGDVTISGTKGAVEARTQSGDIKIDDVAGRLDVATLSGDIEARGLTGDVQIKSVNGDAVVTDLKGDFEGESTSGSIELRNADSRYVRSHTVSGDLVYDGTIGTNGRYELVTHSGDIRLAIPSTAGAQLTISTWSGSIESDFPITLKPGEHGIGSQTKRFVFEIGNGSSRVTAETFSGDITISSKGSSRR